MSALNPTQVFEVLEHMLELGVRLEIRRERVEARLNVSGLQGDVWQYTVVARSGIGLSIAYYGPSLAGAVACAYSDLRPSAGQTES